MAKSKSKSKRDRRRVKWTPHRTAPYIPPGTISVHPEAAHPAVRVIAYSRDQFIDQQLREPEQIRQFLHKFPMTWVNVDGLGDADTIKAIGEIFGIHGLALEDVVHVRQRSKVDEYERHIYIVARMIDRDGGHLGTEQLSMFLGKDYVLTFQERAGDCLDAIRNRARQNLGRVREASADYLAYAILDAVVDEYFPVLEHHGDRLEELEDDVFARPDPAWAAQVHDIKRELLVLRRAVWPLREAVNALHRHTSVLISPDTRVYFRDLYDHTVQLIDLIEVYRELSTGLIEMYISGVTHRMNEIIKVLTIISTIFIPLTFIAGIYGMNFDPELSRWNMPELRWRFGYFFALGVMATVAMGMLAFFWRRGWLGRKPEAPVQTPTRGAGEPSLPRPQG